MTIENAQSVDGAASNNENPQVCMEKSIQNFARFFKAIGDEKRLTIVSMIAAEPGICSSTILKELGISQPTLSHHMSTLINSGAVCAQRQGKWMHYTLNKDNMRLAKEYLQDFEAAAQA